MPLGKAKRRNGRLKKVTAIFPGIPLKFENLADLLYPFPAFWAQVPQ